MAHGADDARLQLPWKEATETAQGPAAKRTMYFGAADWHDLGEQQTRRTWPLPEAEPPQAWHSKVAEVLPTCNLALALPTQT